MKYSKKNPCIKCGNTDGNFTEFNPTKIIFKKDFFGKIIKRIYIEQHMKKVCSECGYSWKEFPLDLYKDQRESITNILNIYGNNKTTQNKIKGMQRK
jgi:predicted nucleic-acid-binding Zn-ribbon protein